MSLLFLALGMVLGGVIAVLFLSAMQMGKNKR